MANLKLDLLNRINNEKMFAELELVRLAQEPNMNYKDKIELMDGILYDLSVISAKTELIGQYFQDNQTPNNEPNTTQEHAQQASRVHQGQTHGE